VLTRAYTAGGGGGPGITGDFKESVVAASTANRALTGLAPNVDGIVLGDGDRVLLKDQTTPSENGIWIARAGAWERPVDWQTGTVTSGALVPVEGGTVNDDTLWMLSTADPITVDVTAVTFTKLSLLLTSTPPLEITDSTNVLGTASDAARSDHQHAHGNRGGGSLHALATAIAHGFMSSTDKAALDAHLIDFTNPHQTTTTQGYLAPGGDVMTLTPGTQLHVHMPSPTTGTIINVLDLGRASAGTGNLGVNDGVSGRWSMNNAAGTETDAFEIGARWDVATAGSETAAIVFRSRILGLFAESMRFQANGVATQLVAPFQFYLSPNADTANGLQLTTIASDTYVIPIAVANGFYLGNSTADPSVNLNRTNARAFDIIPLGTTISTASPPDWIALASTVVIDVGPTGSLGGFVAVSGSIEFRQPGSAFGAGNLFKISGTIKNESGANVDIGSQYTFVHVGTYQADGAFAQSNFFHRVCLFQPTWSTINGATMAVVTANTGGLINPTIGAGVTVTNMRDWEWSAGTFTGTVTNHSHLYFPATNAAAATIFEGIRSLLVASANHRFIRHVGTAQSDFGGAIGLGSGATIDVVLSRGAANRMDLASGDDFRLVSGSLQFAGTAEQISRTAGELLLTATTVRTSAELEIDGTLDHDGTTIGFFGTAPAAQAAAYTPTNVTTDRAYDANSTTIDELADVLGTLIADLQSYGLLQ
jgi:hypothetical protein